MSAEILKEELYRGFTIRIYQDEMPGNPREEFDNLGVMLCKYRDECLGDYEESKDLTPEEIIERVNAPGVLSLPLYLLDHSGLWIKAGAPGENGKGRRSAYACDPGGWDTSFVGWIMVTAEAVKKEWKVKRISPKLKNKIYDVLRAEVETYNQYLTGEVYGYQVEDENENVLDSCWGYYGEVDYPMQEGRAWVDWWHKEQCFKGEGI